MDAERKPERPKEHEGNRKCRQRGQGISMEALDHTREAYREGRDVKGQAGRQAKI